MWLRAALPNLQDVDLKDAGEVLAQRLLQLMKDAEIPNGLTGLGYNHSHLEVLTDGAMPQRRLLDNAPKTPNRAEMLNLYSNAMKYW